MKFNKLILCSLFLLMLIFSLGIVSASDNLDNGTLSADDSQMELSVGGEDNLQSSVEDNEVLSDSPKTIEVPFNPKEPNEVLWSRIRPAIENANSGDTIIIKGSPVHCHLTINKKLTIISDGGTIDPCPHHTHIEGVMEEHGVFYITKEGSGSVIQGFNFVNDDRAETPFAILIDGASDVTIKDCTMNFVNPNKDKFDGIIIKNANNIKLSNFFINNTINGITIINSSNIEINDCIISYSENQAISVSGDSKNIYINDNSILNNANYGIYLTSINNVNVLNNIIQNNGKSNKDSGSGIYVNNNITKFTVKGNFFISNGLHAIMYDYRTRNLNLDDGADQLTVVNDNFFTGHDSMILHHRTYIPHAQGDLHYDAENDVYGENGEGKYIESKSYVYMQRAFIYLDTPCGFTYYTNKIPWSVEASGNKGKYDLSLKLGDVKQVKNGVYSVSIVDSKGNVASDFNGGYLTFFLNDCNTVTPKTGDIYRQVPFKNGVATADFRDNYGSYKSSGNVITASLPGMSDEISRNPNVKFNVKDSDIPINPATKLSSSKLTTYPVSGSYFSAKLVDSKGKAISGKTVTFKVNGKTYSAKTDKNGIAKFKVSLTTKKTYSVSISFAGDDDYKASKVTGKIVVKTGSKKSKIKASNMKIKKNKKKTFQFKLTANNGKALKNQKVTAKVNGKTYSLKTNSKGIAKLSLKFKKVKKYKVTMKFLGNANYKAVSKTNTISVTKK